MRAQASAAPDNAALVNISRQVWPPRHRTYFGSLVVHSPETEQRMPSRRFAHAKA